jgi:amino acid adenylation domain-containing protein
MDELDKRTAALSPAKRALLEQRLKATGGRVEHKGIRRSIHQGPPPLSFNQERLWFLYQLEPDSPAYNLPTWLRFEGELNVAAIRRSVNEVLRRHEILRTRIEAVEGRPVQVVESFIPLEIPLVDLSELPAEQREAEAKRLCTKEAQKPFNLARDLMLRARLFRLEQSEHVLFLNRHHIASDGWSWGVLMRELEALYQAFSKEQPSPLAELPVQYADFAMWQRAWLQDDVLERQLRYWQKQLDGAPASLELPTDRRARATPNYCGALLSHDLPESLSLAVGELGRREGITLFMTLLAAFQTLLHRYTSRDDIPVGSVVAGRNRTEVEGLIGFFANTLVFRGDLSGDPSFRVLLQRTRTVCVGAYAHQDMPFGELVKELQPARDMSHSPLFQVMFVLQNAPVAAMTLPGLRVTATDGLDTGASKFELSLSLKESGNSLNASVEYRTDLFDAETIRRILNHYQNLLEGIAANPDARLSELPLLAEQEREQIVVEWNRTETEYPKQRCVHELFAEQAARRPDAVAVVYDNLKLSYRELDQRTNQLAHYLRTIGVGADSLVGICMERSMQMIVGVLAILKAGGAYVPLDPSYPKERLGFMLRDAQARVVLSQEEFKELLPQSDVTVISLDSQWGAIARYSTEPVDSGIKAENLAYVIYTSGSTGIPKGVMVEHRGIVRLVCNSNYISFDSDDRVAQISNASFDAITFELWGALLNGASLVGISRATSLEPALLGEAIAEQSISTLFLTTSLFNRITAECPWVFHKVHNVIIGGEAADAETVKKVLSTAPPRRLVNGYGPTENTTFSTWYLANSITDSVPIGRPIANSRVYVLDDQLGPVPVGVTGELYVAGDGLARGYLNRPELTAEKFITNPLPEEHGKRLYRTGDLVRWRADGELEFLGRMDQQVKIRGYRIELGEIESVLRQHEHVKDCVVLAREDRPGDTRLVACLVVKKKAEPNIVVGSFRSYLKSKLPDYMVPPHFVVLESLPLTPNGKLDLKALPGPELDRTDLLEEYVEPLTPMEKALAEIWARVLGVERVGVNDNFFELGGHSLLAVQLFSQIEKRLGHNKLPIASLFRAPTIAALAALIHEPDRNHGWSPLIAIQPQGDRLPFFAVHHGVGQVLCYRPLARLLGPNQPFYGFQSQGLDGRPFKHTSVEAMASYYIEEMRGVQPHGPYFLGGYCTGGMIAFEMAQQLHAEGEEIALLVLFDAQNPARPPQRYTWVERVKLRFQYGSRLAPSEQIRYFAHQVDGHLKKWQERFKKIFKKMRYRMLNIDVDARVVPNEFRQLHVLLSLERARDAYKPRAYPGRIALFRATTPDEYFRYTADYIADFGWTKLAGGGLEIHHIPGDHVSMFGESNIGVMAEKLRGLLRLSK